MRTILFLITVAILVGGVWWYGKSQGATSSNGAGGLRSLLKPLTGSSESARQDDTNAQERITVIAEGLDTPWAVTFLPSGEMLITERAGRVRLITEDGLQPTPVVEITRVKEIGEGGLLGLTLHPDFADNGYVYLYYTYSGSGDDTLNRVVRMRYENGSLVDEEVIVDEIPGASNHNGGRIHFGPDGFLYITTGDAQEPSLAQDTNSLAGKVLRVTDGGEPAPGNPFGSAPFDYAQGRQGKPAGDERVYSYGHRNPQGLAWDEVEQLFETEHGPSGFETGNDEFNRIDRGKNYGWPEIRGKETREGMVPPIMESGRLDTWAPAGLAYVDGIFYFAGLRGQALYRVTPLGEMETFLKGEYGRLREVITGPDGLLYVTTSNRDGRGNPASSDDRVLRINPAKL